ncbi:MAG: hypothetical protein ACREJU_06635 [Nitrospiraceae bacterium]
MSATLALSRGWLPQTADKMAISQNEFQLEPIADTRPADGIVVQSSLERVAVFTHNQPQLSLSDISHMRRVRARSHARRAVLFVRKDLAVASSVSLLATLSKIEIVQINMEETDLCPCS